MTSKSFPHSLWAETAVPQPDFAPLGENIETEVCIVGGGFTGLSTAIHLAERGIRTIVLESRQPGWGASGRNGGQVIPGLKYDPAELVERFGPGTGDRLVDYVGNAPALLFSLIDRYKIECDASTIGWIQPAHSSPGLATIRKRAEQWSSRGADIRLLDRAETAALIGSDHYLGAALDRRGGSVQPLSLARGMARVASDLGVRIFGDTPATALETKGESKTVRTPRGAVTARTIVLATNGYTDNLWPGLARSVVPVHSFQVATTPLPENLASTVLPQGHSASDTRRLLWYFRKDRTGRLLMGGRGRPVEQPGATDTRALQAALWELYPQLEGIGFEYHWGGRVAMTADHLPHLHRLDEGVFAGLGFNGRGVAMTTAMGKVLAAAAAGEPLESLPIPASNLRPIPLHAFRSLAIHALTAHYRRLDRKERSGDMAAISG